MENKIDPEKVSKVWKVVKQIIDLIIAALVGGIVSACRTGKFPFIG